jgi:hypothetical protein
VENNGGEGKEHRAQYIVQIAEKGGVIGRTWLCRLDRNKRDGEGPLFPTHLPIEII